MKLTRGRNIRPRAIQDRTTAGQPTIEQLTEHEAEQVARSAYYSSRDCLDQHGRVIGWEKQDAVIRRYWRDVIGVALTTFVEARGFDIVPASHL
jgi:hypothetical protein